MIEVSDPGEEEVNRSIVLIFAISFVSTCSSDEGMSRLMLARRKGQESSVRISASLGNFVPC